MTLSAAAIDKQVARMRALCAALPEVEERVGQHHTWLVRGKKFAYHINSHHGDGRVHMQCKAEPGLNVELVAADPVNFFLPPYLKQHGWIAVWLDLPKVRIDWDQIEALVIDAYRLTAPKRLAAMVEG